MTFFPEGFDPRDDVIGVLHLVSLETASGTHRFMLGADGVFTDSDGKKWYGSQLFTLSDIEVSLNGNAPAGQVGMSYFQDPDQPDLIAELKESGETAVSGRSLKVYTQPLNSMSDFYAPTTPPILFVTRTMRSFIEEASGDRSRSIAVTFEGPWEARSRSRRLQLTTADHARLIGETNPSLELMPTDNQQEEKLWG